MAKSIRIGNPYNSYQEDFSVSEDPLSRGGRFLNNTNTLLTRFRAASGRAIAKATGQAGDYDDSAALMDGFGPDVEITATVYRDVSLNTSATHECEFLFRASQTSNRSLQYEALFAWQGSIQAVRWYDSGGQQFEFLTAVSGPQSLGRGFVTGDRIRARMQGSILTMSCIDASNVVTVLGVFNNSVLASGMCGLGGFVRVGDGGNPAHFCFEDVLITEV